MAPGQQCDAGRHQTVQCRHQVQVVAGEPALAGHSRVSIVRAHLLEMMGDHVAAGAEFRAAAAKTLNLPERQYLQARAARLDV